MTRREPGMTGRDPATGGGTAVRRFRLGDLPRVLQIERLSFGPDSYSASTFLAHVLRDRKGLFVAEDEGGKVVGYALVRVGLGWIGMRRGGVTSIAVEPSQRRRGVGRALLAHALGYLREQHVAEADLEVNVENRAAQSLYEAFGFRRSRLLRDYYGGNRDGLRMVLDLRSGVTHGCREQRNEEEPTAEEASGPGGGADG